MEALGKTRVVIEDGKVVEVGEPEVTYCPLFFKHRGIERITKEIVRENMEFRIRDFGMCTPQRRLRMKDFLSFGVSELMGMALEKDLLDCVVIVCDGAGTVIVKEPALAQGIGGRVSGILETSPIEEIIGAIGRDMVLDPERASIDQLEGVRKARKMGFRRIGVSVAMAKDAEAIRKELGDDAVIFAVHTSGLRMDDVAVIFRSSDIVTGCASSGVHQLGDGSCRRAGSKVPVYAVSGAGGAILDARLAQMKDYKEGPEDFPRPLI
jgi:putative methanogenesis marker protein 8